MTEIADQLSCQELVEGRDGTPIGSLVLEEAIAAPERPRVALERSLVGRLHLLEDPVQEGPPGLRSAPRQADVPRVEENHLEDPVPGGGRGGGHPP